jgi:cytoskeletal protein CcmA (bactofilin family)
VAGRAVADADSCGFAAKLLRDSRLFTRSKLTLENEVLVATVIGQGIIIEGEVTSDEAVVVAGTVRGKLTVDGPLTIEAGAVVEADVGATSLSLGGTVTGNVTASDRVDLLAGSRLVGDVRAGRVTIADGAVFKGSVDMDV